jgi:hypothetical protein
MQGAAIFSNMVDSTRVDFQTQSATLVMVFQFSGEDGSQQYSEVQATILASDNQAQRNTKISDAIVAAAAALPTPLVVAKAAIIMPQFIKGS